MSALNAIDYRRSIRSKLAIRSFDQLNRQFSFLVHRMPRIQIRSALTQQDIRFHVSLDNGGADSDPAALG